MLPSNTPKAASKEHTKLSILADSPMKREEKKNGKSIYFSYWYVFIKMGKKKQKAFEIVKIKKMALLHNLIHKKKSASKKNMRDVRGGVLAVAT